MAWTPKDVSQYAATCVFLVALAVTFRGLIAVRSNILQLLGWMSNEAAGDVQSYAGIDDAAKLDAHASKRWAVGGTLIRAVLDTVLGGVSYLL